jgi:uncharacterized protein
MGWFMRLGFNYTLADTYDMVGRLVEEGHIDYVELLIDNFFCVPPAELGAAFPCPVSFHIMFSRFFENDNESLKEMAQRIRPYIQALNPIYVSDHCAYFSHQGRRLFHIAEYDYAAEYKDARKKCEFWQNELGTKLLIENYPSIMSGGHEAPEFFERLQKDTGVGVLFDASNAVCARENIGLSLDRWRPIIESNKHFHVAGYSLSMIEPFIQMDTHSNALSEETINFLASEKVLFEKDGATMTYERDSEIDYDDIVEDLIKLREVFPRN